MREDDLKSCVQGKYVLSLEVTNGLDREQFGFKVSEALSGKKYLRRIAENPDTEVEAGLIFTRNENAITSKRYALDFLYQIETFNQQRALRAISQTQMNTGLIDILELRPGNDRPPFVHLASAISELVRYGMPLAEIFYPDERQLETIRRKFPELELPESIYQYNHAISDVKGVVLEDYVKLLCEDVMPDDATVIARHRIRWKGRNRDVDVIVAGDKDKIIEGLRNAKDLHEFNTVRKEKQKFYRPQFTGVAFR